jgi:hypothetical protein
MLPRQHIYMAWHAKMDDDPGHKWLREAMLTAAKERLGAPLGASQDDARSNVTAFPRPAKPGPKIT